MNERQKRKPETDSQLSVVVVVVVYFFFAHFFDVYTEQSNLTEWCGS